MAVIRRQLIEPPKHRSSSTRRVFPASLGPARTIRFGIAGLFSLTDQVSKVLLAAPIKNMFNEGVTLHC
jgi:hypothetical protein